jgi:beta-alanine--pyruvate transaminase
MENTRKAFMAQLLPQVDHLCHTHDLAHNAYSRGLPVWGASLADDLERIVAQRGAHTIAAVIVEPVAGATGVLPPPAGYLERLQALSDQHGILLIFDEVITGFGRVGAPFAANRFGIVPDMITCAKGLTNGAVPMGAVAVRRTIYDAIVDSVAGGIEFFHGYTYSGHPLAAAAGLATLDVYQQEGLFERAAELAPYWEDAVHALRGLPHVIDLRNYGLLGGIELEPRTGQAGARGFELFVDCFNRGALVRAAGDTICLSPPLIIERQQIDELFGVLAEGLRRLS